MNWNEIVEALKEFWNQPVPIIGFTVGTLIIGIIVILSKTSIGTKALNWLKGKYQEMVETNKEMQERYEAIIKTKDEFIASLTQMYEDKLALVQANKDKERDVIIAIGSCINNVKIKKIIEEYKGTEPVTDISSYTEAIKQEYESKYIEVLNRLEELENGKTEDSVTIEEEIPSDTI